MIVIGVDPGTYESAYVVWDGAIVLEYGRVLNDKLRARIYNWEVDATRSWWLVIEELVCYGNRPIGKETHATDRWSGRFEEAWQHVSENAVIYQPYRIAKQHLCGKHVGVGDPEIRRALIDRFGPTRQEAIGSKASPGPLYGVKKDVWQALAHAVTWYDLHAQQEKGDD